MKLANTIIILKKKSHSITKKVQAGYLTEKAKAKLSVSSYPPWLKLCKTDFIRKHNIKFAEKNNRFDDVLFQCCLIHHAKTISYVNKILYYHRVFPQSISEKAKKTPDDFYFDHFKTIESIIEYCQSQKINPKIMLTKMMPSFNRFYEKVHNRKLYKEKINYYHKKYGIKRRKKASIFLKWLLRLKWKKDKKIIRILVYTSLERYNIVKNIQNIINLMLKIEIH